MGSVMSFLADPSLPGLAEVTGSFSRTGTGVLAVGSAYRLLTEPPARASYGGQRLRYRVALYRRGERRPFAVFDHLRYSVNDVAFHPSLPVVAIATGEYDGGMCFEGELVLWNWETGRHVLAAADGAATPRLQRKRAFRTVSWLHRIGGNEKGARLFARRDTEQSRGKPR
jgi:hypothetical protein